MIHSIQLNNFLSFGSHSNEVKLEKLNIIIGTNGSGKSNFLEAFDLIQNIPVDIEKPIREGGGVGDWIYKGNAISSIATLTLSMDNIAQNIQHSRELIYQISFSAAGQHIKIMNEKIENKDAARPGRCENKRYLFYDFRNGNPIINTTEGQSRQLQQEEIDLSQSILVQKRDALYYPEITHIAQEFSKIKMYRDWAFGRYTPPRNPQKTDLPSRYLDRDCGNLALVLNQIRKDFNSKQRLLKELKHFYKDVADYEISIEPNHAQILFQEEGLRTAIPGTRLSDGTLRYLCLLSILCHPDPPPLICIEEPELGLHPDILSNLATLLKEASERCQLIVTTHSEILVNEFTDTPNAILVAEKSNDQGTQLTRLNKEKLKPWLKNYALGELWSRGDIGGNRW